MIVCICHRVSDRDIARTAQSGCASFEELQFELLVATSCGKCHDCAHETFKRHAPKIAATEPPPTRCHGAGRSGHHTVFPIAMPQARETAVPAGA